MAKPELDFKKLIVQGKRVRRLTVTFPKAKRKILILDNYFGLERDIPQNTFVNLCYEVCAAMKRSHTFVYVETAPLTAVDIRYLIKKIEPDAIVYGDLNPFRKMGLGVLEYFAFLRENEGIPSILTTDFRKWTAGEGFEKGEAGKNLIGFNLKHLLTAARGHNPFKPVTKKDLTFTVRIIRTLKQAKKFFDILEEQNIVCIDVEGAGLNRIVNTLFTVQFGLYNNKGGIDTYVLPWKQKDHTWSPKELRIIGSRFRKWLLRTKAELVFHYAPYDIGQIMVALEMDFFPPNVYDTIGGQFALDENHKFLDKMYQLTDKGYSPYSLDHMEPGYGIFRPKDILAKEDRKNMSRFSLEEIAEYGAWDVVTPLLIRERQIEQSTDKFIGYAKKEHYKKVTVHQLGVMVKVFAMLMNTGIYIDLENANKLVKKDSVFTTMINDIKKKVLETKNGQKANRILLKKKGINPTGGMFSSTKAEIFSLTKPDHLRTLFFDVMKLEGLKQGKSGEFSTDKSFQKAYKHLEEVKLFGHFNKVKTLKSNFADGLVKLSKTDPDFINDGRLRPMFGFTKVLPGRISVNQPNSQNIPNRSDKEFEAHKDLVKSIKKNFSVRFGRIMMGSDFSAHEVRVAGIITKDPEIRRVFLTANNAIRKYRLAHESTLEAAAKVLAKEGDIHIQNVLFFFKKEVDKSHVLRDQIKQVVFGVLYGKMAKALAKDLGIEPNEAQALIDILFDKWGIMSEWIDQTHEEGKTTYMVKYPNYRIRHLWAYINDDVWVHHAMDRRSVNSPIQGVASDIGIAAVYCYKQWVFKNITQRGFLLDCYHTNIVHDAQYSDNLYEHMPLAVYLTEHSMSTLPQNYYRKKFNFDISIPLSYGLEFGPNWSALNEWNFRPETLQDMLRDEGKRLDKKPKQIDQVIEDTKYILKIRTKELKKNPYRMLINKDTVGSLFEDLHMFKNQKSGELS